MRTKGARTKPITVITPSTFLWIGWARVANDMEYSPTRRASGFVEARRGDLCYITKMTITKQGVSAWVRWYDEEYGESAVPGSFLRMA